MITLDTIRSRYPHMGLAVYALEPGGPVTLEVYGPSDALWSFTGPTETAVLAQAFPLDAEPPEPIPKPDPGLSMFD